MFEVLDRQLRLTGNQKKIIAAAVIGDALEFFDYFVLAFLIGPWKLTFGQSATVLMSSGIGAIIGAYAWGWLADKIGRRKVFIGTVLNFSFRSEAHLRPVGDGADELRHWRHHRRLCLGLARRQDRPAQGVHRHGAELLDRDRPALLHAGQWLGLPHRHADRKST